MPCHRQSRGLSGSAAGARCVETTRSGGALPAAPAARVDPFRSAREVLDKAHTLNTQALISRHVLVEYTEQAQG